MSDLVLYIEDRLSCDNIIVHLCFLILQVLAYFSGKLEQNGGHLSPAEVLEVIKQGSVQFRRDRLKVKNCHQTKPTNMTCGP